jgi:hypothetical protein
MSPLLFKLIHLTHAFVELIFKLRGVAGRVFEILSLGLETEAFVD